jgi:hypothetical protein
MQRLEALGRMLSTASSVAETVTDLTRKQQRFQFAVSAGSTFYLDIEHASLSLRRHDQPLIVVDLALQAPFAWRVASEQDANGVYIVARRRRLVAGLAGASLHVALPAQVYGMFRLAGVSLALDDVSGSFEFQPDGRFSLAPNV